MLTFRQLQDAVLERFKESRRADAKTWLRAVYGDIWALEEWTFKQASALVTVTAGSQVVSGLPADVGIVHLLQRSDGVPLEFVDWLKFNRRWFGDTGQGPLDYTVLGAGASAQMKVGPASDETSSLWQVLYERDLGYYPSTTLGAGVTLPAASIQVATTAAAPSSGLLLIGGRLVAYTGKDATHFTGCTGGTGAFITGDTCVILTATAGELAADSDVPLLPSEMHMALVFAAQALGQAGEQDFSMYLSDDRVQQTLEAARRRYLIQARDTHEHWGETVDPYGWG